MTEFRTAEVSGQCGGGAGGEDVCVFECGGVQGHVKEAGEGGDVGVGEVAEGGSVAGAEFLHFHFHCIFGPSSFAFCIGNLRVSYVLAVGPLKSSEYKRPCPSSILTMVSFQIRICLLSAINIPAYSVSSKPKTAFR